MEINTVIADYKNQSHANDIIHLLNIYAEDPMGGGAPLKQHTKDNLVPLLAKNSSAFSIITYVEQKPAGLANCFTSFSTFKCRPLINIHDLVVSPNFRGLGISQKLLAAIESRAKENDCCKITLEVLDGNKTAQKAYEKFGFNGYALDPKMGNALFWEKAL